MNSRKLYLTCGLLAFTAVHAWAQINIGFYKFKNGAEYTGELKGKKPNGKGKTLFKNGDVYEGEYLKGKRQGEGTYLYKEGEKYVGEWYQDQKHGKGTYYFMNNDVLL